MKEVMDFINQEFEEMKKKFAEERKEKEDPEKENRDLREQYVKNAKAIAELTERVVQSEQYSRRSNIEIRGLEQKQDENVAELVGKIGVAIGEPITIADMDVCHRVPTRNPDKLNVVMQFVSRRKRDLEKARSSRVRNSQLGLSDSTQVFINEHSCPTLKRLLSFAIERKRQHQW